MLCYAKSLQSCPTLSDPIDGSPPGSPVPGILQARTLEWAAISFSNAWKFKEKVKSLSRVWLLATPWTAAYQAPPSMGFSRQEYWSGVPLPSPDEEVVVHICNGILLGHKKEQNPAICRDVVGPWECHMEWSQSERGCPTFVSGYLIPPDQLQERAENVSIGSCSPKFPQA